jgi:hypothetical protein
MRVQLEVTFADGDVSRVTAIYPDLAAFEEKFDRSVANFGKEVRLSDLGWLAWHVLHRTSKTALTYEEWANTVEIVDPDTSEGDPTAPLDR